MTESTHPSASHATEHYEAERTGYLRKWKRTAWALAAAVVSVFLLFSDTGWLAVLMAGGVLVILKIVFVRRLSKIYKAEVVPGLIPGFCSEGRYFPDRGIDAQVFTGSHLFDSYPDRYSTEDLVTGQVEQVDFCFAEVKAQRKEVRTDSKGNTRTTYTTFFDGFLFVADFHKSFSGQTVLLPGRRGSKYRKKGRVKLESVEFDKFFRVYSTDEVEARYILTPSLMERFTMLAPKFSGRIRVSFTASQVIVAIPDSRDHYEGSLWINAEKSLERDMEALGKLTGIVKELKMNPSIWSKDI